MSGMDQQAGKRKLTPLGWIAVVIVGIFLLAQLEGDGIGLGAVLIVGIPVLLAFLVIRALVRVGDKRPEPVQVVSPAPQSVPAGWYPDQVDPRYVRWFDGTSWTDAVLPAQGPNIPQ